MTQIEQETDYVIRYETYATMIAKTPEDALEKFKVVYPRVRIISVQRRTD